VTPTTCSWICRIAVAARTETGSEPASALDSRRGRPPLPGSAPKAFLDGTHRTRDPRDTWQRLRGILPALGVTRVANVTGLDVVGIPVVMAVRPNARSVSVSQGKGLTLDAARASGVMEALELHHAERIEAPLRLASYQELRLRAPVVDPETLVQTATSPYHRGLRLLWIEGTDLVSGEPRWLPYELVHTDFTLPLPPGSGCFPLCSNGLASGNHPLEAAVHALSEVVERHSCSLWWQRGGERQDATRLELSSVADPHCRELLERYRAAGLEVAVWNVTSEVGVAAFYCAVRESEPAPGSLGLAVGSGCHPSSAVALGRALCEAAQGRLTMIAGSRDDLPRLSYELARGAAREGRGDAEGRPGGCRLGDVPEGAGPDLAEDLAWLLDRVVAAGFEQVLWVDLTHEALGVPVARMVVPGMLGSPSLSDQVRSPRRRAS